MAEQTRVASPESEVRHPIRAHLSRGSLACGAAILLRVEWVE